MGGEAAGRDATREENTLISERPLSEGRGRHIRARPDRDVKRKKKGARPLSPSDGDSGGAPPPHGTTQSPFDPRGQTARRRLEEQAGRTPRGTTTTHLNKATEKHGEEIL